MGCSKLKSSTIPDSVTTIAYAAFKECKKLKSITISDSVTIIGDYAFSGCKKLKSITIPDSVTAIGEGAFEGCGNSFTIHGTAGSYAETYANENGHTFVQS